MERIRKRYLLNGFLLAPDEQLLTRQGQPVHLPKRPFQVLLYLVENRDRFISRTELLDQFWDGKDVYDDALRKCIGAIRKALNEQSDNPRFIETRWGVGYRYIGPIQETLVPRETAITEIEKTRGVKIVVEEEEIDERVVAHKTSATPTRRKYLIAVSLAVVVLALGFGVAALVRSRRPASNSGTRARINSIAVLPIKNLTGDPANDYLSDGITESLITRLSKTGDLKVISRGSAFTFKDKSLDPKEAGRLLNVSALLEGSLIRSGERLRVNVRLVSTADGEVLWAGDSNDRQIAEIFEIQDEIAASVSSRLGLQTTGQNRQQLARRYTANPDAYQNYLKGRYFLNQRKPEAILKSTAAFQRAIELDPNYALAYAAL